MPTKPNWLTPSTWTRQPQPPDELDQALDALADAAVAVVEQSQAEKPDDVFFGSDAGKAAVAVIARAVPTARLAAFFDRQRLKHPRFLRPMATHIAIAQGKTPANVWVALFRATVLHNERIGALTRACEIVHGRGVLGGYLP